jgi:transcription initiation factor IIE alpha subunit
MPKLRLMGLLDEVERLLEELRTSLTIVEESKPYACRPPNETQVRVYLEVHCKTTGAKTPDKK